jgi:hypothetical protein
LKDKLKEKNIESVTLRFWMGVKGTAEGKSFGGRRLIILFIHKVYDSLSYQAF